MDNIDTSSETRDVFTPSYVIVETELPNSAGKEYLRIRNYNPNLAIPKRSKDGNEKQKEEEEIVNEFCDKKIFRKKGIFNPQITLI